MAAYCSNDAFALNPVRDDFGDNHPSQVRVIKIEIDGLCVPAIPPQPSKTRVMADYERQSGSPDAHDKAL
jgi:hypothetical protein